MQSINRENSPHRWAVGSESYPGPCSWRPSRAGAATGSLQESGVELRRSSVGFSWKKKKKKELFFYVCLIFQEIKNLTCILLKCFIPHFTAMKHGLWELLVCE